MGQDFDDDEGARRQDEREILRKLTRATLDAFRAEGIFLTKRSVFERASRDYDYRGKNERSVAQARWQELSQRFRLVLDPPSYKAERIKQRFNIRQIHIAANTDALPDEAARLHTEQVQEDATCFYSCGKTLADTVRAAAASLDYDERFTACSSVVLATDAPVRLAPSAVTAGFHRDGNPVRTMSFLLPAQVQDELAPPEDSERRRKMREAIARAVFSKASEAKHPWLWLGIGTVDQDGSFADHVASVGAARELERLGAVGEVGFMPFSERALIYDELGLASDVPDNDKNWGKLSNELRRFFNTTHVLKFNDLPENTDVVVVAGGENKHRAIWSGLDLLSRPRASSCGGVGEIAYLVTDRGTIDALYARLAGESSATRASESVSLSSVTRDALETLCAETGRSWGELIDEAVERLLAQRRSEPGERRSDIRGLDRPGKLERQLK